MSYIQGVNRQQTVLFPEVLDDYISPQNPVRVLDAYVDELSMEDLGFTHAQPEATGRPPYHPGDLLKLYVYGYMNKIRSSRALERETWRNIELMWLVRKLHPDFKTIADFRRDNTEAIKRVGTEFTLLCRRLGLFGGKLVAIDGSKFAAVNHNSKNYTKPKLKKMMGHIDQQISEWLGQLDQSDQDEEAPDSEQIQQHIEELRARRSELEQIRREMDESGQSQCSQTDPEARMMRGGHGRKDVSYNVQIAVDDKYKLILAHQVTNQGNDISQLLPMALQAKQVLGVGYLEVTADKGYYNESGMVACEQENIHCYLPRIDKFTNKSQGLFTEADFTWQPQSDSYQCPAGQTLPYKSTVSKQGKQMRIYETKACGDCPMRGQCTRAKRGNRRVYRWELESVLERIQERSDSRPRMMRSRAALVEHPFGTLKRAMGHGYFLTKGLKRVGTEMNLSVLAYNLKRVIKILGVPRLIQMMRVIRPTYISVKIELTARSFSHLFKTKRNNSLISYF